MKKRLEKNFLTAFSSLESLRKMILSDENLARGEINIFLEDRIKNPGLKFAISICDLEQVCALQPFPEEVKDSAGNIYAEERVISSVLDSENFAPKKIKLFLWRA
mgnify:CR=1 FL=1